MAKLLENGSYILQMVVNETEYESAIGPQIAEEGLSESSFLRVRCGLLARMSARKKREVSTGKRAHKRRRKKRLTVDSTGAGQMPFVGHTERKSAFLDLSDNSEPPEQKAGRARKNDTVSENDLLEL